MLFRLASIAAVDEACTDVNEKGSAGESAKDIGQETVNYVSNIYKYYVAYKLAEADAEREKAAAAKN